MERRNYGKSFIHYVVRGWLSRALWDDQECLSEDEK